MVWALVVTGVGTPLAYPVSFKVDSYFPGTTFISSSNPVPFVHKPRFDPGWYWVVVQPNTFLTCFFHTTGGLYAYDTKNTTLDLLPGLPRVKAGLPGQVELVGPPLLRFVPTIYLTLGTAW